MAKETFNQSDLNNIKARIKEDLQNSAAGSKPTANESHLEALSRLMNELIAIACDTSDPDRWAKSKLIEAQIKNLGVSKNEIQGQKMAMLSARLGLDYGGINGVSGQTRKLCRNASNAQDWLIPNLFPLGKASLIYGDSGAGKTSIALHIANAYIEGMPFADSVYPAKKDDRKVLFIASDGQGDAYDHLIDYAEQSGFLNENENFANSFEVYAASEDNSSGPFNFSEPHLANLFEMLKKGEYGLVFVDSLKAACMGTNFTIDDRSISLPMRLVQAMCAKAKATLIWLHHTNKSNSESSHRAGGSTDVIEIVSSAHELKHKWDEISDQGKSEWLVQKLRGSSKRKFSYSFDFESGLVLELLNNETPTTGDKILTTIHGSANKRLRREELSRHLALQPKTLSNHALHLKGEGLIRSNGKAWELTGKGIQRAKELENKHNDKG